MSVRLTTDRVALYDSVTEIAFGPTFRSVEEAEAFLRWYPGPDLRTLSVALLDDWIKRWRETLVPDEWPVLAMSGISR